MVFDNVNYYQLTVCFWICPLLHLPHSEKAMQVDKPLQNLECPCSFQAVVHEIGYSGSGCIANLIVIRQSATKESRIACNLSCPRQRMASLVLQNEIKFRIKDCYISLTQPTISVDSARERSSTGHHDKKPAAHLSIA